MEKTMNYRMIVFSGIMVALVGAMVGIAVSRMSDHAAVVRRELSGRRFAIVGASLGFVMGAGYEAVRQQKPDIEEELRELREDEN